MSSALRGAFSVGLSALALAGVAPFAGCLQSGAEPDAPGARLELAVAPLSLPNIGQACYAVRVTNAAGTMGDVVWQDGDPTNALATTVGMAQGEGALCSGQYGNGPGGDIAVVGPCDAGTPAPHTHTVTLWLENLYDLGGSQIPPGEWDNPCATGYGAPGCSLEFQCSENADVAVTFNLTVMRDANQGFFDVAVNFEDVFCSAKLDCSYDENHNGNVDPGEEIKLLFNGPDRDYTAVIGLACTAGPSDNDTTTLHLSDVRVRCDGAAMQLTSAEPVLCAPDGTVLGFGQGFLRQDFNGVPAGSLGAIGFRMIDNATTPWGYQYEPFTLPTPGSVWGFDGGDQPFEGFFPQALTGNFTSAGNVTGPRIAGLLMNLQPGQTIETAVEGMQPAIGWIPPTSQGDVVFQAVLENPPSVAMVTSFQISGGNNAWLVANQDMNSDNPWGPPVAWHLTPILAHIDGGFLGVPPSLVGTILGDLGGGICRVDLVKDDLAVGSCPTGGGRRNVVWDFNDAPVNDVYVAIQLPEFVLPNVNPATDWVTRGTAGGIIGIPNENTLVAENLYYSHTAAAPGGMPIAQLSATVYTRASAADSWTTASATHLKIAPALQVEGRDGGFDLPWRDDISAYGHDFMVITAQAWNAGAGFADRQNLVLATPPGADYTSPLLTWSEMSTANGTARLGYALGLASVVNPANGTLKRYAAGSHSGSGNPSAVIWPLPDAGSLPANQAAVTPLSSITLPAPAGMAGFHYHLASWHHRFAGPTAEERVALVGTISDAMERSLATVAWFLEYDAGAAGNVTIGEPQLMASAIGEDVLYDSASQSSGETFGWWSEPSGFGNSTSDRRIRIGEVDRDWDAQAPRCDKMFARGSSFETNGPNGGSNSPDTASGYVFAPSYSTADDAALTSTYPLSAPSWFERAISKKGRRNMVNTTDAAGRIFSTIIGLSAATGVPVVGGLRYDTPSSTPVAVADPNFTQYDGLAVLGFLDNSTTGQYGLAMFANADGVDASPIVDSGLAIVDVANSNGAVVVKEALTPPAGWSVSVSKLDATTGIVVAGSADDSSLGGSSWFDVWHPSRFVFFKPTTSFTFTTWSGFGEAYPSGGSPNGYENAIRMSNPECTSCTGDACMTCQILDVRAGKAVGKCVPTVLCDDLPGYYFWNLLATPSGGAIGSTRLGDPGAAALDPGYTSGSRNPSDSQEVGFFLTTVADTYPVFMASYRFVVPPEGMNPQTDKSAVVVWPMTSTTTFGAPVVFFKGSPSAWISAMDGYVFGSVFDEEDAPNIERAMVLKEPTTFAGATTPDTWLRWSSLSIPGQTVTHVELANPLPGRDMIFGTYQTGTGPGLPFVAALSGNNTAIQQAFGEPAALAATIPSGTQWETNGYAWVRFTAAASPKAQPAGMVTINGNSANVVVWNIPDDLSTFTPDSGDAHVVTAPAIPGEFGAELKGGFGLVGGVTDDAQFAPRDTLSIIAGISAAYGSPSGSEELFGLWGDIGDVGVDPPVVLAMPSNLAVPPLTGVATFLPVDGSKGNHYPPDPDSSDTVYQYATYWGDEQLDCGGVSCNKRYFNIAVGFDPAVTNCIAYFDATASDGTSFTNGQPPSDTVYPFIHYAVPLSQPGPNGQVVCGQNPVGVPGSFVQPEYRYPGQFGGLATFCYQYGPGESANGTITDWCNGYQPYDADAPPGGGGGGGNGTGP